MIDTLISAIGITPGRQVAVFAYLLAAFLAWRAGQPVKRGRRAWTICAMALAALALERQFALFSMPVDLLRDLAVASGWYEERRPLQRETILVIGFVALVVMILLGAILRRRPLQLRLAVLAVTGLIGLALIKAVSLHRLDHLFALIPVPAVPMSVGAAMELAGLAVVMIASLTVPRKASRSRRR